MSQNRPEKNVAAEAFANPSPTYGPVPFWWWSGDSLDRARLAWQLEQLHAKGIHNAVVSYNHHADGTLDPGSPVVFSPEWWTLFRSMVEECKARGMQLSFQDYCVLNPMLQEIGREMPEMQGGQLVEVSARIKGPARSSLVLTNDREGFLAFAYPVCDGRATAAGMLDLTSTLRDGALDWAVPEGEWLVSLIGLNPNPFDPMHPDSGAQIIRRFYAPFEAQCPGELGRTISISFQDELDFGARMPLWSSRLLSQFRARKGCELAPLLAALWHDLGPITPKVRIDYHDVVTQLLEESYFIPVYQWHEARGLLFGHDNCGRGAIRRGHEAYGDPFRTMRWYSAPGTDDPNLDGARAFEGLKVNSSIAHLNGRPRVWCECFHSSGWGTRPADVIAALHADFIYGATVVNLHGLYYSTHGSWWEWAPPDFHFRQPYWKHIGAFNAYVARLCQTLSAGRHVCDVAMLYPITTIEAGIGGFAQAGAGVGTSLSEAQAGHGGAPLDECEAAAFGLGNHLVNAGIDFDFIDFQSLERAEVRDGALRVSGEAYRVLLLPMMAAVRFSSLEKAREFSSAGGVVLAYGCLPWASERRGSEDAELDALVAEIFGNDDGRCRLIRGDYAGVKTAIAELILCDFKAGASGFQAVHRRTETHEYYFVFNPADEPVSAEIGFRACGKVERWDAWTGNISSLDSIAACDGTRVCLSLGANDAQLIVFDRSLPASSKNLTTVNSAASPEFAFPLEGRWEFELVPTMDNQFGDFRLPVAAKTIAAEARQFRYAEDAGETWQRSDLDDASWPLVTASYGPRFWKLGPISPGADYDALAQRLAALTEVDPARPITVEGREYFWSPYAFSLRWGIENDPFLKDWASGPHGLKSNVPDEFLDLHCDIPGARWFLWTAVQAPEPRALSFQMGSRSSHAAWLNGELILQQEQALPPGRQSTWSLPHYRSVPHSATVGLTAGNNPLLLSFVQPEGQRVRAHAAFSTDEIPDKLAFPALRWFRSADHPVFNYRPNAGAHAGWYRFVSPPGLASMKIVARGGALRAWVAGVELPVKTSIHCGGQRNEYCVRVLKPHPEPALVALRLEQAADSFGGDALLEPVLLECVEGHAPTGDWSAFGLATYSGAAWYRKSLVVNREMADALHGGRCFLELGEVAATAEVIWNGQPVGTRLAPPWRVEITNLVRVGQNRVEILVANTLANHYSVGIPTYYVFDGQTVSGLLGPVCIRSLSHAVPTN